MGLGRVLAPRFQPCTLSVGGAAPSAAPEFLFAQFTGGAGRWPSYGVVADRWPRARCNARFTVARSLNKFNDKSERGGDRPQLKDRFGVSKVPGRKRRCATQQMIRPQCRIGSEPPIWLPWQQSSCPLFSKSDSSAHCCMAGGCGCDRISTATARCLGWSSAWLRRGNRPPLLGH